MTGLSRSNRETLTQRDELFALEYLANGYNATAAYKATHPRCRSANTAAVEAHRLLRKPKIATFIQLEQQARNGRLRMDADEALEGITRHARADIRKLFKDGRLLPTNRWPDEIADCVRSIKHTAFGPTVVMYDKLRARELMAIAGGVLKSRYNQKHTFDHAAYLGAVPPFSDDESTTVDPWPTSRRLAPRRPPVQRKTRQESRRE